MESDPARVAQLQTRLLGLCSEAGLDELTGFQLTCAVIEAVNNCIEHAYDGETGYPIMLQWSHDKDLVKVEIRDQGNPMPDPLPASPATPDVGAESGRGWHIIRQWTDSVGYARQGKDNVLTLTRRL